MAKVIPIFKSGDVQDMSNYGPISILSVVSKTFEHVIDNKIFPLIKCGIALEQHGFFCGRSVESNLRGGHVEGCQGLSKAVDAICTDVSKVFDRVNYDILLKKLSGFRFSNKLVFFCIYLYNRQQFVSHRGACSDPFRITSGVVYTIQDIHK